MGVFSELLEFIYSKMMNSICKLTRTRVSLDFQLRSTGAEVTPKPTADCNDD